MLGITCKCGHTGPHDSFTQTMLGDLPPRHYQCPACGSAWQIVKDKPAEITKDGFFMPPTLKVVGAQAQF